MHLAYRSPAIGPETSEEPLFQHYEPSKSVTLNREDALELLTDAVYDHKEPDWDGYGASPVSIDSYIVAIQVLNALPGNIPSPEIGVDPDGEISFEWWCAPRNTVSISIGPDGTIAYAGLFGHEAPFGTDHFTSEVPPRVLALLGRLYSSSAS